MKKKLMSLIAVICLYAFPIQAYAGPLWGACMFACGTACHGTGIFAGFCLLGCGSACAMFSCFSSTTTVIVLENGVELEKNIGDIRSGDTVRTLRNGRLAWTKVLRNTKTEGDFEFMQIKAKNTTNGNCRQLKITPAHGMVLINEDGQLILDAAEHMVVGDKVLAAEGDILSVTDASWGVMQDKYTLETADGTVIASGVFVSTICDEEVGGEQLFEAKMEDWKEKHERLARELKYFFNEIN